MRRSLTTALVLLALGLGGRAEAQGVNQRVADLEALVVQMQAQIDDLSARLTAAEQGVDTNTTDISNIVASGYVTASDLTGYATQTWVTSQGYTTGSELGDLPDLASYLSVNTGTNAVVFSGANVYVQNGSGGTSGINGLGNLIVGYDESNNDLRGGSHNLEWNKTFQNIHF